MKSWLCDNARLCGSNWFSSGGKFDHWKEDERRYITWVNYWDKEQERWSASRDRLLLFRFVLRSSSVQDFEEIRSLCSHSRMNVRLQKQTTNHLTLHDVLPVDRREVWWELRVPWSTWCGSEGSCGACVSGWLYYLALRCKCVSETKLNENNIHAATVTVASHYWRDVRGWPTNLAWCSRCCHQ